MIKNPFKKYDAWIPKENIESFLKDVKTKLESLPEGELGSVAGLSYNENDYSLWSVFSTDCSEGSIGVVKMFYSPKKDYLIMKTRKCLDLDDSDKGSVEFPYEEKMVAFLDKAITNYAIK